MTALWVSPSVAFSPLPNRNVKKFVTNNYDVAEYLSQVKRFFLEVKEICWLLKAWLRLLDERITDWMLVVVETNGVDIHGAMSMVWFLFCFIFVFNCLLFECCLAVFVLRFGLILQSSLPLMSELSISRWQISLWTFGYLFKIESFTAVSGRTQRKRLMKVSPLWPCDRRWDSRSKQPHFIWTLLYASHDREEGAFLFVVLLLTV